MITPEILNYIKQQITNGVSREQISNSLKQNGWNDADITEAFTAINTPASTSNIPHAPQVVTHSSHVVRNIIILIILFVLLGGAGWWWFYGRQSAPVVQEEAIKSDIEADKPKAENLDDLKVNYVKVPAEENSVSIFNAIPQNVITKADKDFLVKFVSDNQAAVRPIVESKKVLAKYTKYLEDFESGVEKKYYQCSISTGDTCYLNNLRSVSQLSAVNSFVLWKEGKIVDAKDYAQKIIKLGKMFTKNADDIITLLVGWEVQKTGYYAFKDAGGIILSSDEKNALIKNLREEQKKLLKIDYSRALEIIDYITDINNKPSIVIDEPEELAKEFRNKINDTTWKPEIVKKWFTDSLKIELANTDLACGVETKDGKIETGFNPSNVPETENFVGQKFYFYAYISFNTASAKRCEIESLINAL